MSQIQEVKDASNIIDVIGSRISLQRSGSQFRGLCPFHSEKSPSFFVSETMQRYKCFGCGESGDVLEFLQKYEGMSFYEALSYLADQAGIEIQTFRRTPEDELREQVLEVLDLTKEYFHYLLTKHDVGSEARAYLKKRGVSQESIKLFQLGFAVDSWDALITFLTKKKKYPLKVIQAAGLVAQKGPRSYDRFRGRLMFPLKNNRGQVVGFSGRVMAGDEKSAKYINSPETLVYHKSKLLFGYHELLQEIRKANEVIVVEGEFDVISSVQAHTNNVVGIKGSALTADHAKILARVVDTVILALDTDDAGIKATRKAIGVVQDHMTDSGKQLELRVVQLPSGKDPDDLAKSQPKVWRDAVKQAVTAYEFLIEAAAKTYDSQTPTGKRKIVADLAPVLVRIHHEVELESYVRKVASILKVKPESVRRDLDTFKKQQQLGKEPERHNEEAEATHISPVAELANPTPRQKLEVYAIFLALHSEANRRERLAELQKIVQSIPAAQQMLTAVLAHQTQDLAQLRSTLPQDLDELLFHIYAHSTYFPRVDELDISAEWQATVQRLEKLTVQERITEISKRLSQLDDKAELSQEEELQQQTLLKEIVSLQAKQRAE